MKVGVCPFRLENKVDYDVFLEIYPPSSSPTYSSYSSYSYIVDLLGASLFPLPPYTREFPPPWPSSLRSSPSPLIWRFPPRSGDSPLHHLTLNRSLSLHRKIHLFNTSCDEVSFVLFHQNFENICSSNHQIITQSLRVRSFVFNPFP